MKKSPALFAKEAECQRGRGRAENGDCSQWIDVSGCICCGRTEFPFRMDCASCTGILSFGRCFPDSIRALCGGAAGECLAFPHGGGAAGSEGD